MTCEKRSDKISLLRLTEKRQRTLTNKQQCNPEKFLKQKLDFSESSKERPRNSNARLVLAGWTTKRKKESKETSFLWKFFLEAKQRNLLEKTSFFPKVKFAKQISNSRVRSWLRMNAGGVLNTCKSNGLYMKPSDCKVSGGRVSNAWVTCPTLGDNSWKRLLIPHKCTASHEAVWKTPVV